MGFWDSISDGFSDVGNDMAGAFRLRVGALRILFDVEGQQAC